MNFFSVHLKSGQTLVEAIVVIGVVVLLVTGLIAGTTVSLRTTRVGRVRTQAIKYAQEAIEIVRSIRDQSWSTFFAYSGFYCLDEAGVFTPSATDTCTPNIITPESSLTRSVVFTWNDPRMVVKVSVGYVEGESQKTVELTTYFTQWR